MIETTHTHRLRPECLRYLQTQYNCNLAEAENQEEYFDKEDFPVHVQIVDEDSYFAIELLDNWPILH